MISGDDVSLSSFTRKRVDYTETFIRRCSVRKCFPENTIKFLKTHILQNNSGQLLLVESVSGQRLPFVVIM